jgi:hypothetical protein
MLSLKIADHLPKIYRTHNTINNTATKPHATDHAIRKLRNLIGLAVRLLR